MVGRPLAGHACIYFELKGTRIKQRKLHQSIWSIRSADRHSFHYWTTALYFGPQLKGKPIMKTTFLLRSCLWVDDWVWWTFGCLCFQPNSQNKILVSFQIERELKPYSLSSVRNAVLWNNLYWVPRKIN